MPSIRVSACSVPPAWAPCGRPNVRRSGWCAVGVVAERYISGEITDDADVAQIHGPAELGCPPLSEALVNIEATLEAALRAGALSTADGRLLSVSAKRIFFKDRTLQRIVEQAGFSGSQADALLDVLEDALARHQAGGRHGARRENAVRTCNPRGCSSGLDLPSPTAWRRFIADLEGSMQETR